MLILDDNNEPIIIENVHTPTITEYMWTLDLTMMDFTISPILTFEEITSNSIMLRVLGKEGKVKGIMSRSQNKLADAVVRLLGREGTEEQS